MDINIKGVDKVKLVKALYERARPQGLGFLQAKGGGLSDAEAAKMAEASWLDYVHGRVMKTSVVDDTMRADLFDRDNGRGEAQAAVDEVRAESNS